MNSFTQTATTQANLFTCAYVAKTNKITITINNPAYAFRMITQLELKTIDWTGSTFDRNKPNDINEIISNLYNFSKRYFSIIPYISGSVNLQPFNNVYIHSTNLGNYNSIGAMGEQTIVNKNTCV